VDKEKHIERHKELHKALDELVADFIANTGRYITKTTIYGLLKWSSEQTKNPQGDD